MVHFSIITLKALEGLKELCERLGGELLVILGGHLDADLEVLPDVGRKHGSQTLQRVLHGQRAKEVHQPLQPEQNILPTIKRHDHVDQICYRQPSTSQCFGTLK